MDERRFKLIRADFLIPLNDADGRTARIEDGYVLTNNALITEYGKYTPAIGKKIIAKYGASLQIIGKKLKDKYDEKDIVKHNGAILPGFVKAHGHDHESPIIGIAKDEPLTSWLDHAVNLFTGFMNEKRGELEKQFGVSPNYVTYIKARIDDIMFGITSSMVHHCNYNKYRLEELYDAAKDSGAEMIVAVGSQDRNYEKGVLDKPEDAVKRLEQYEKKYGGKKHFTIIPGPDQFFSNGPEMLKGLKKWARDNGRLFHIHSAEEPATTKWFRKTYGMTEMEYADKIGILDENTVLAHQVNCLDIDLELIRDRGAKVVHNPLANTILGSGMPPIIKMLEMGIPVVISTDGSGSADNQNIIAAARLAAQYQKALNKDAELLPAQKVLEMITVEPAKLLGFNSGSIARGKNADIIMLDLSRPNLVPTRVDNIIENIIWAAAGNEIKYVISKGKLLLDDYNFTTLDDARIKKNVQKLSELLIEYRKAKSELCGTGVHR